MFFEGRVLIISPPPEFGRWEKCNLAKLWPFYNLWPGQIGFAPIRIHPCLRLRDLQCIAEYTMHSYTLDLLTYLCIRLPAVRIFVGDDARILPVELVCVRI